MKWSKDIELTKIARRWLRDDRTTVYTKNGHYFADKSPYGQLELLSVGQAGFLVSVSDPPDDRRVHVDRLPKGLPDQLSKRGLTPWRVIPHTDARKVLLALANNEELPADEGEAPVVDGEQVFSVYVRPLDEAVPLIGERRHQVAGELAALTRAQSPEGPLSCLFSPRGAGRHVVTATALTILGRKGLELPLSRILLVDRIFQTPMELLLEILMAAQAVMTEDQVLVVSDAHLLAVLSPTKRQQVLGELRRLPGVILLAETSGNEMELADDIIALPCPGLDGPEDAKALLDVAYPKIVKILVPQALAAACRGVRVEGFGILPARFLYVVRLSSAMVDPTGDAMPVSLSPDELQPAIRVANQAWQTRD